MKDQKWERYAALGGVVFVILNIVGAVITGSPPAPDASTAKIVKYLTDHDSELKVAQALAGVSALALLWWFGSLWRRMSKAEDGAPRLAVVSLAGLALSGALFLASGAVLAAAVMRSADAGDGITVYWALGTVLLGASGFGLAAHLAATNALAMRTKMFPTWIVGLGLLDALAFLVSGIAASASSSAVGMGIGIIAGLAWAVWILAVSFVMWRPVDAATAGA